ncbi:hypothetical protein AKJ64_03860 [candidate division MSBL1 archaeon SCGC-AAA259E17]|uniref:Uncharacterized protein n=1 Tax=candidate division MSBL1 archaeon SCGC-AAA259E17 TaxID=1698263 RepID=A0A133UDF6_9EURY|nr:hypothetical protein AKJ64_03860 [candidate division MSBL1 archaeon SCGC-AAA259E17]
MPEDEENHSDENRSLFERPGKYTERGKRRRIKLLRDQLEQVKRELRERWRVHEKVNGELKNEVDYSKRMLDRVKKHGPPEREDRRKEELRRKIDELKKERWRERVRAWRDTQDLMREARKLNRALSDLSLRLEGLEDHFGKSQGPYTVGQEVG